MNEQRDSFELKMLENIERLKQCQSSKNRQSCFKCEVFFTCELRKEYVDSVYFSMSKDKEGNFDF